METELSVKLTYVFLKRPGSFTFDQPLSDTDYRRTIVLEDGQDLVETSLRSWILESDQVVERTDVVEVGVSEKLLNIHRRVHNQYGKAYKDVLDMEYLLIIKKEDETYDLARYPGPRRSVIDYNAKLFNPFIEAGVSSNALLNPTSEVYLLVLVLITDDPERRALSDLVERYLHIENRDYERAQILEENKGLAPIYSLGSMPSSNIYSRNQTRSTILENLMNSLRMGNTGNTDNFSREDSKREERLQMMRDSLGVGDAMPRPFPNNPDPQETISSYFSGDGDGDLEVTYAMMPGGTPQPIGAEIIRPRIYDNPWSLFGTNPPFQHLTNLLLTVNGMPLDLARSIDLESLMEPVRVTVDKDGMAKFLSYYEHGDGSDVEKKLRVSDQNSCAICLTDYEKGVKVCYLDTCHHLFHEECIKKWLSEFNHKCPVCRMSADPKKNDTNLPEKI